ncbi:MAG: D-lyxose/D-mannose family sugar isomerase [Clostridiales bacterium]|jgi:D-lyxose ketol-isomerase|nr:D-lyxose/D-mannose family sugar isomerase [Clostridiales bacterium]
MKRSEINAVIKDFEALAAKYRFALPPFCAFEPDSWNNLGADYDEIRENMLGWDVTDYGGGDFRALGLSLVTIRNGNLNNPKYPKTYAEKLIMSYDNQLSPMHYHYKKMEDIINRGGGDLMIKLYNSTPDGAFADTDVEVSSDGRRLRLPAGHVLRLAPGQSVTLQPGLYHEWRAEGGSCLIGEVSQINDDNTDNRFYKPLARFSGIEEDERPYRLLCNEYPR